MTDLREELARSLASLSTLNPEEMVKGASGQFEPRWRAHLPAADLFFVPIIARVRAEERERCAKVAVEKTRAPGQRNVKDQWRENIGQEIAAAIRALGDE